MLVVTREAWFVPEVVVCALAVDFWITTLVIDVVDCFTVINPNCASSI